MQTHLSIVSNKSIAFDSTDRFNKLYLAHQLVDIDLFLNVTTKKRFQNESYQ